MKRLGRRAAYAWLQCQIQGMRCLRGRRIRLVRQGFDFRIVIEPVASMTVALPPAAPDVSEVSVPSVSPVRVIDAQNDLKAILDRHPAARSVWPSLALVERALGKHGGAGIVCLPAAVLRDAAPLIDLLVDDWGGSGVALLQEYVGLVLRTVHGDAPACNARHPEHRIEMQVQDASMSEFMEIDRQWNQHPGRRA